VNVVAPHDKHIKGIQLRLVGSHRLHFPRHGSTHPITVDEDFLVRELTVDGEGKGLTLEKGVNTYVPAVSRSILFHTELTSRFLMTSSQLGGSFRSACRAPVLLSTRLRAVGHGTGSTRRYWGPEVCSRAI
jgi:hypothetical protein